MRQSGGVLQVVGEMVAIVVLALTGRFVGFAQTTLESGVPLTIERAFTYFMELLSVFTRVGDAGLLVSVLGAASLIRISIAYANRSVLLGLREIAGIDQEDLTAGQRILRLPLAIVYRSLNGIATLIGAIALAICFRLFNPESPFGFAELVAYVRSIGSGMTFGGIGALVLLFALYGVALTIIGYVASPAVLSLEEMATGCRPNRRMSPRPQRLDSAPQA
jgi:hypothetical protein